jgi:hypothetical protein
MIYWMRNNFLQAEGLRVGGEIALVTGVSMD